MLKILHLAALLLAVCAKYPPGFKFGAATAALQIEGAWLQDNKAPSVWDNLAHLPNFTADGTAPDIAADSYNRYKEDIDLLVEGGIKHYRMSLSWPRIVPRGRRGSKVNEKAIKRYTEMFQYIREKGITPYVTLYHWDLPAVLSLQGYGLVDRYFPDDFLYYADVVFKSFKDYVKNWYTFNEPWVISVLEVMKDRDKATKPYEIGHNLLIAHARTVKLYREVYQSENKGVIGMVFNTGMSYPKNPENPKDVEAAYRAMNFSLGWFADPVFFGDYPEVMKQRVGRRLPRFNETERQWLKGSSDFFAFNHYTSSLTEEGTFQRQTDYNSDVNVTSTNNPAWKLTDMNWPIVPEGIHDLIVRINEHYIRGSKVPIYVTENGMANKETTSEDAKNDRARIEYLRDYLANVEKAIDEGVNVMGYFVWSLLDNFEWWSGFSKRFGIVRINYGTYPTRETKASFYWYRNYIKDKTTSEEVVA